MNTLRLSVPSPCHEDWNKMAPRGHGSFCSSCEKVVVDFSKMNDPQVMEYMQVNADKKICGRFAKEQLERPLRSAVTVDRSMLRAFIYALFLVFGSTLFSCTYQHNKDAPQHSLTGSGFLNGKDDPKENDEKRECNFTMGIPAPPEGMINADTPVAPIPPPFPEQNKITGEVVNLKYPDEIVPEDRTDTVKLDEFMVDGSNMGGSYTMGIMAPNSPTVDDLFYYTAGIQNMNDSVETKPIDKVPDPFLSCYPNPGTGSVNVKYVIMQRSDVTIELFDLTGKMVMRLISTPQLYEGTYIFPLDISSLADGTYICTMKVGEKVISEKIILGK
jgi:hypothetical protein